MTEIKHPEISVQLAGRDGNAFMIMQKSSSLTRRKRPIYERSHVWRL